MSVPEPCLCGGSLPGEECCGPVHSGAPAVTAEALMRSRFSAFAGGGADDVENEVR